MILDSLGRNTYRPNRLWKPTIGERLRLARIGFGAIQLGEDQDELELIRSFQSQANTNMTYNSEIYRARLGLEKKKGNCLARSEYMMALGKAAGLKSYMVWDGCHATSLFKGNQWWIADATMAGQVGIIPGVNVVNRKGIDAQHELLDTIVHETGGRAFIRAWGPTREDEKEIQWKPIEGQLGDNDAPYDMATKMILTASEAALFMGAFGDITRYIKKKPEMWEEHGDAIQQFVPANWAQEKICNAKLAIASR